MTVAEIYDNVVKPLPASERLALATRILNEISPRAIVDYSDEWSDEDLQDVNLATMRLISERLDAEEAENAGPR